MLKICSLNDLNDFHVVCLLDVTVIQIFKKMTQNLKYYLAVKDVTIWL